MSHQTMLPPPPAAPRRDETEHGPKAPSSHSPADSTASEQAAPSPAPPGASLVPVAFTPTARHGERNEEGPPRKSRRLAFVLLPAAAAIVIGGLGFAAAYGDQQPFQGAQHAPPPFGVPTEAAQPSACPAWTTAPACSPSRFSKLIVLPEVIIRRETPTSGPDDIDTP